MAAQGWCEELSQRRRKGGRIDLRELLRQLSPPESTRIEDEEEEIREEIKAVREWATEFVRVLKIVHRIEARVSKQNPLRPRKTLTEGQMTAFDWIETWIEIAEGPIRWARLVSDIDQWAHFYLPDSRIKVDDPGIRIRLVPVKSFPLFGRIKGVRWGPSYVDSAKGFSQRVADSLNRDPNVMQRMLSSGLVNYCVSTEPGNGWWKMGEHGDHWAGREWSKPLWDCYEVIARHLLAMPIPTEE